MDYKFWIFSYVTFMYGKQIVVDDLITVLNSSFPAGVS